MIRYVVRLGGPNYIEPIFLLRSLATLRFVPLDELLVIPINSASKVL